MIPGAGAAAGGAVAGGAAAAGAGGLMQTLIVVLIGLIGLIGGAVVVGGVLIFTGSPTPCGNGPIPVSSQASQQMRAAWKEFAVRAARAPANAAFTESQITSRGVDYIKEKNAPIEELQVFFCPQGYAEASGKVKVLGLNSTVVVRGTVDVSGPKPVVKILSVRAGNLPGSVAKPIVDRVLDAANVRTIDIDEHVTNVVFSAEGGVGRVTVSAQP
jgi:hypothetical protein